jgi:hypothetical protein
VNHEVTGKKQEFGPGRPVIDIQNDLAKGQQRMTAVLNHWFSPFFTPPMEPVHPGNHGRPGKPWV